MADKKLTTSTLEEADEKGYLGTVLDETPNEAYTVEGSAKAGEEASKERDQAEKSDAKKADAK